MTEAGGAEGRGSYFNSVGAIRDVMQNRKSLIHFKYCMSHRHRRSNADTRTAHNGTTKILLSGRFVRRKGTYSWALAVWNHLLLTSSLGPSLGLDATHRVCRHHHRPVRQVLRWQEARI